MPSTKEQETLDALARDASTRRFVQRDALRFAEADVDDSLGLSWDEFLKMQPPSVREHHSVGEIRTWFESADINGDGTVSVSEFFTWTLTKGAYHGGIHSIEAVFRRYDSRCDGSLDEREFQQFADDVGFGAVAHDLFMGLDSDNSGVISCARPPCVLKTPRQKAQDASPLPRCVLPTARDSR